MDITRGDASWKQTHWVAVVDDDAQIAQTLKLLLSFKGVRASVHGSAESLLASVSLQHGRLQLDGSDGEAGVVAAVVLDLNLPGMSGADLVLRLRALQRDLKIVMITAALDDVLRKRGADLQGVTCLSKPFSLESLEAVLFGN